MRRVFLRLFFLSFVSSMAWTQHSEAELKPEGFSIEELGFSFQTIKAGSFTMGSPLDEEGRDEDEAQVEVTISKAFEMQTTELTQKQYFLVTRKKPSYFRSPKYCENYDEVNEICPDHPVEQVSWYDAKEFISLLNAFAGVEGCEGTPEDPSGCYRLPTEAEYEWAVRAGTETAYFFGNNSSQLGDYAVYWGNSGGRTHKVTTGKKNPNELNGIIGNVWEWTEDSYAPLEGGYDPLNRKNECELEECRVIRGGGWKNGRGYQVGARNFLRSANRGYTNPESRVRFIGFRLVRTPAFLMSEKSETKVHQCRVPSREDAVTPYPFLPLYSFYKPNLEDRA